jgi:hypothetical protein
VTGHRRNRFDPRAVFDRLLWCLLALEIVRVVLDVVGGRWFDAAADVLVSVAVAMTVLGLPDPG